jgi:ATP-dependent exoDNAse (exonuclease V) beta subunit
VVWLLDDRQIDRYEHTLVDEAQDLSPMRLHAMRRRSATSFMTVRPEQS